jgi:oxygen-independent coproporphyrinogen-3 oxidase
LERSPRRSASSRATRVGRRSIYLGGGTPSLLPPAEIGRLIGRLRAGFDVAADTEVTLEANPEDVTADRRDAWIAAGVNRVSVGIQSFHDRELAAVGRRHDARRAREALADLSAGGLSLSGDLILGLPEQTRDSFRESLRSLLDAGVDHVSIYLLETDKSRALEEDRRAHPDRYVSDDVQADLWLEASGTLSARGLEHYEISNWGRPGSEARHNLKYWRREPTLGLGIAAHELWGGRRRANVSAIEVYCERLARGQRATAMDRRLDPEEEAAEEIVLGLRLSEGVEKSAVEDWIATQGDGGLAQDWAAWREEGWIRDCGGRVALTERGFLVSNEILCRFV